MEAIGIVLAAVAIIWLIVWCIRNEGVRSISEQKGLFGMLDHEARDNEEKRTKHSGKEAESNRG